MSKLFITNQRFSQLALAVSIPLSLASTWGFLSGNWLTASLIAIIPLTLNTILFLSKRSAVSVREPEEKIAAKFVQAALFFSMSLLLIGTWYFLYIWIAAMTEGLLAPWDTVPGRPPLGTWARTVNDFFGQSPGAYLPSLVFVSISASLFVFGLRPGSNKILLLLAFTLTNLIFFGVDLIFVILAHQLVNGWLPSPGASFDAGYHRTWPAIVITAALITILFFAQLKIVKYSTRNTI